ncbi:MAG: hypothetical protein A3H45_07345 [Ignavibacteria bacterium RIFCSPLOWO2_02_FULL_55_14]|nr:MAG: hypothetical protein A3H45_07345 [Ignavibacteria bacterium RIFCSPLOWO2_02_FULL_55_14]
MSRRLRRFSRPLATAYLSALPLLATSQMPVHFSFTANTGNNATIAVPVSAHPAVGETSLVSGDEIGVFIPGGICAGAVVWTGVNTAITVWGDNDQTPEVDGARAGDRPWFRVWLHTTQTEHDSVPVSYSAGDGTYFANAMHVLASLGGIPALVPSARGSADGRGQDRLSIYPNPFNPTTNIIFNLDRAEHVRVIVTDVAGRRIAEILNTWLNAGSHTVRYDASTLKSGVYACRIIAGSYSQTRLMILVR